jgi:LysR family transcriptional regulator, glycine cleavage system transcriptional activator
MPMRPTLPPMNALRAFEAVARCGSLNAAAAELGVVRGAVRQQLAVIESHFGRPLFVRSGRRLQLTEEAAVYFAEVTVAFAKLRRATQAFERASGTLRFGVPSAFAMWWLMPRLSRLETAMGAQSFTIVPLPAVRSLAELPEIDAVIMGAEFAPAADITAVRFLKDEFGPVGAPSLLDDIGKYHAAALAPLTAIIAGTAPTLWQDWFNETGQQPATFARTTQLEDLVLALASARAGNGVTIAPKASIEDDLASGRLIAPFGFHDRPSGYHVCYRSRDTAAPALRRFVDWLRSEAEQSQ